MESDISSARPLLKAATRRHYLKLLAGKETARTCSERDELERAGLVVPDPERPGHVRAVDADAVARTRQADLIRSASSLLAEAQAMPQHLADLASAYRAATASQNVGGIEILTGLRAINERLETLVNSCTQELITAQPTGPRPAELLALSYQRDLGVLQRGARMRTIYLPSVRSDAPTSRWALTMAEQGAEIRTGRTFGRMIIVDRRAAVLPILDPWSLEATAPDQAAVITSELAVGLAVASFERDWAHSEPWDGTPEAELKPIHVEILRCLAQGLEQDEVAQQLGMSKRTVQGKVADLRAATGCRTQSQLLYWWAKRELQR
ncbi:hypothetical protein [Kitasatospora sp. NPDC056181]|uniref:hypothetical protein n=1 Tax=Kitasatospora sp. NPDC056181 TaxID=3345737 RepID=UPI0035DBFAED